MRVTIMPNCTMDCNHSEIDLMYALANVFTVGERKKY